MEEQLLSAKISSSSSDESANPSTPGLKDDFKTFQDLRKQMSETLDIPMETMKKKLPRLSDFPHTSVSRTLVMPINKGLLDLQRNFWQTTINNGHFHKCG